MIRNWKLSQGRRSNLETHRSIKVHPLVKLFLKKMNSKSAWIIVMKILIQRLFNLMLVKQSEENCVYDMQIFLKFI
jgi:hypothetical protein